MALSFIYVAAGIKNAFQFIAKGHVLTQVHCIFFLPSPSLGAHWLVPSFCLGRRMHLWIFTHISLCGHMFRFCGNSASVFCTNHWPVFYESVTIFHSPPEVHKHFHSSAALSELERIHHCFHRVNTHEWGGNQATHNYAFGAGLRPAQTWWTQVP